MNGSNNFYAGKVIHFATKHEKEKILAPLFQALHIGCEVVEVNTDQFGTFSGEIERIGSARDALRQKIQAGIEKMPNARLLLASEGSFVPDPFLGFSQINLESLLLWDRKLDIEIYAEYMCRKPAYAEVTLGPKDDFRTFLTSIDFPDHGVIVRPENSFSPVLKGLGNEHAVAQAMLDCFMTSQTGKVIVATDLRANQNKTRREAIRKAGQALVEKLQSFCPSCGLPGFSITRGIPGLKCEDCGEPTQVAGKVLLECVKCPFSEERPRPDGRTSLSAEECEYCNP